MFPAEPPISAAKLSADSVSIPSGTGYRSIPARPTMMPVNRRAGANSRPISNSPTLAFPALIDLGGCLANLRPAAFPGRSNFPPCMAFFGPCVWIDFDVDEIRPLGCPGALECLFERRQGLHFLRQGPHRAGGCRKVYRERLDSQIAVGNEVVERDIAGTSLKLVDDGETTIVAKNND